MDPRFAPAPWSLAQAYAAKGTYDRAIAEWRLAIAHGGCKPRMLTEIACCCALAGHRRKVRGLLREIESSLDSSGASPYHMAVLATALGELHPVNALLGGWQISGIWRHASGMPSSVHNGRN